MIATNLLELLDGTLVNTTALVDQVTSLSSCQYKAHGMVLHDREAGYAKRGNGINLRWSTCRSRRGC